MRTRTQAFIWTGVSLVSLTLHVAAFGGLGKPNAGRPRAAKRPPTMVEMTVAPLPPATPAPAAPAAKPARKLALARPARVPPATVPPPSAAPPPAAETPADFTGTTLTNDGPGPGWAAATGNGLAMKGPVGTPGAKVTGSSREGGLGDGSGPPVVGVGDLSQIPQAPDLASLLARYYPVEARRQGKSGKAVIRARIMPDGALRELKVISESQAGFGAACRQTLQGSRWTPPLDRTGQAVSTYINYACRFEVH
jgi:TonB family protein